MREKILFNHDWEFHKGDIETTLVKYKDIVYNEAKTERALRGPASRNYNTSITATEILSPPFCFTVFFNSINCCLL